MVDMSNDTANDQNPGAIDELIALLDAVDASPGATSWRTRSYDLLNLSEGMRVKPTRGSRI
jgi:hypothetical protein